MSKKFQYCIRIWKDVEVSANDLDEALDRVSLEPLVIDEMHTDVVSMEPTGISEDKIDKTNIHSNN